MAERWENNILGFVPKEDWLEVGFNVTRQNDPIDGLFGDEKTDNLVAKWESIASEYQIPVMAQFHGFDTEAQKTFRAPRERMRTLLRSGVQEDALYDYVINDGVRLAEQVFTRSKVAKNELLASGKVTIKENNLDLTVDYGVPSDQLGLTLDFGTGASKTVPEQLQDITDAATAKGVTLTGIVTAKANVTKLRQNADIQKAIYGNNSVGALVRNNDLRAYLEDEFGIGQIVMNDLSYGASASINSSTGRPSVVTNRYFPATKVSFISTNQGGKMGVGLWGDPPEVDAANFFNVSTEASVSPYVRVMQWMESDPAVLWTKASALFMPVLYNPNSLWIADVTSTSAT